MQLWKKMTKMFVEYFIFFSEMSNFLVQIFFTDYTPQDLPLCEKSASYLENLILYRFLSILVENCLFWVTPPYFGPHVLTPLWPEPDPKNFHMVQKGIDRNLPQISGRYAQRWKSYLRKCIGGAIMAPPGSFRVKSQNIGGSDFKGTHFLVLFIDVFENQNKKINDLQK